jgi:hypothetical protein
VLSSRKTPWISFRSRLPRSTVNTLSYQPISPSHDDFDCGVVSTYTHACLGLQKWTWIGRRIGGAGRAGYCVGWWMASIKILKMDLWACLRDLSALL